MTMREIILRRIELKKQHIFLIGREIQALETELQDLDDKDRPDQGMGLSALAGNDPFPAVSG